MVKVGLMEGKFYVTCRKNGQHIYETLCPYLTKQEQRDEEKVPEAFLPGFHSAIGRIVLLKGKKRWRRGTFKDAADRCGGLFLAEI